MLSIENASCGYGARTVLSNVSLQAERGQVLCLLGPNGVGKTTLFKTILGLLRLRDGDIRIDGVSVRTMSFKVKAKHMGYVPQVHDPPFPFKVSEVVLMGRTAHLGALASPGREDMRLADQVIDSLGIADLRDRIYTELSGGERQLVLIARALAQQPQILVMDEPTSNLDFGNQIRVLKRINDLAERGLTIIMTTHFPNHAFLCSTQVALLKKSGVMLLGECAQVVTEANLREIYGIDVKITGVQDGNGRTIQACIPIMNN